MALSKLTRALLASAISVASILGSALAANAVTNPADNPHPITVTGDDGNTYHDGEDTLPGYDDEECTYIPGAWFDFASNKVHYADGQSIPWTEWDRASGYREWLANHNSNPTPTPTPTDEATSSNSGSGSKGGKSSKKSSSAVASDDAVVLATEVTEVTASSTLSNPLTVSVGKDISSNPGRETGLIILSVLLGSGILLTAGSGLRSRINRGGKA